MKYITFDDNYPDLGMVCTSCRSEIACGFVECPLCEAWFFYGSTGPPRTSALSEPERRKRVDEAHRAFHSVTHQVSPSAKYFREDKKLRKHLERWDSSDLAQEGHDWRLAIGNGRLPPQEHTRHRLMGGSRCPTKPTSHDHLVLLQRLAHPLPLHRQGGSDPEAPEGTEARIRTDGARPLAQVMASLLTRSPKRPWTRR